MALHSDSQLPRRRPSSRSLDNFNAHVHEMEDSDDDMNNTKKTPHQKGLFSTGLGGKMKFSKGRARSRSKSPGRHNRTDVVSDGEPRMHSLQNGRPQSQSPGRRQKQQQMDQQEMELEQELRRSRQSHRKDALLHNYARKFRPSAPFRRRGGNGGLRSRSFSPTPKDDDASSVLSGAMSDEENQLNELTQRNRTMEQGLVSNSEQQLQPKNQNRQQLQQLQHHFRQSSSRSLQSNGSEDERLSSLHQRIFPQRPQTNTNIYHPSQPFLLPPNQTLAPRCDIWIYLTLTSCAALSSLAMVLNSSARSSGYKGSAVDKLALSVTCISFAFSLLVSVGMRYGPSRGVLTGAIGGEGFRRGSRNSLCNLLFKNNTTPELLILGVLTVFWVTGIPVIANSSVTQNGFEDITLAVAGSEIWNANLFYSSWLSCWLCIYLLVEVATLRDRGGVVLRNANGRTVGRVEGGATYNVKTKRWILIGINSAIVFGSSLNTYSGPMCSGLLSQTDYCQRSIIGLVLGGLLQFLICMGAGVLFRLSSMLRRGNWVMNVTKRNKLCFGLGFISLVVQSVNVGLLTSPVGGGPANESGTAYFSSWIGFIMAFELCLRYLESFTTTIVPMVSRVDIGQEYQSLRVLPMGERSVGSRSKGSDNVRRLASGNTTTDTSSTDDDDNVSPIGFITADHETVKSEASASQYDLPAPPPRRADPSVIGSSSNGTDPSAGYNSQKKRSQIEPQEEMSSYRSGPTVNSFDRQKSGSSRGSRGSRYSQGSTPEGYYERKASKHFEDDQLEGLIHQANAVQSSFIAPMKEELDDPQEPEATSVHSQPLKPPNNSNLSPVDEASNSQTPLSCSTRSGSNTSGSRSGSRKKRRPSSKNSKSSKSSKSGKRKSKNNVSPDDVLSSSGSNPPPTIDGISVQESTATGSLATRSRTSSKKSPGRSSNGPPLPPYRGQNAVSHGYEDEHEMSDFSSSYLNVPVINVETGGDDAGYVSEPTIDAHFDPPMTGNAMMRPRMVPPISEQHKSSDSTNDYHRQSSDENPSSLEADGAQAHEVDDIVAAALAYAEKSHGDDGYQIPHQQHRSSSAGKMKLTGQSKPNGKMRGSQSQSGLTQEDSIHSFYSGSQKGMQPGVRANSTGGQRRGGSHVDNLVAMAISQAGAGQHSRGGSSSGNRRGFSGNKSVNSLYSEATDYSPQGSEQHFDC